MKQESIVNIMGMETLTLDQTLMENIAMEHWQDMTAIKTVTVGYLPLKHGVMLLIMIDTGQEYPAPLTTVETTLHLTTCSLPMWESIPNKEYWKLSTIFTCRVMNANNDTDYGENNDGWISAEEAFYYARKWSMRASFATLQISHNYPRDLLIVQRN